MSSNTMNVAPQSTSNANQAVPKKASKGKMLRYFLILLLVMVLTNPSRIPFFPEDLAEDMERALGDLFGDLSGLSDMIAVNWMAILHVCVMVVMLLLLREVLTLVVGWVKPKTGRGATLKNLTLSSLQYVVVLVGLFWGLAIMGVNISTLFASAGIVALIIGFGAESLIADMVTGFFMIFENQYNVGDVIEVDEYRGTVTKIGLRTTSITDDGGNEKIFNNSDVRNIVQLSGQDSYAVCDLPIPYDADLDEACKHVVMLMNTMPQQYPAIFKKVPELLGVQELGEFAVYLRIAAAVHEKYRFDAVRAMNQTLKVGMEKVGMGAPHGDAPER